MGTVPPPDSPDDDTPKHLLGRWRREVIRSTTITDSTRVLLLVMYDDMDSRGYVAVPRAELAKRLDRNERKVSARLEAAVDARLLDRVQRGNRGRTAVYRAMLPSRQSLPVSRTLSGPKAAGSQHPVESADRHPLTGNSGPHGGPASSKATRTSQPSRGSAGGTSPSELLEDEVEVDVIDGVPVARGLDVADVIAITRRLGRSA